MPKKIRRSARHRTETGNPHQRRIQVIWKNLVLFLILFIISLVLFFLSSTPIFVNLFEILFIIFGFLSLALLIILIVFLLIKSGRR